MMHTIAAFSIGFVVPSWVTVSAPAARVVADSGHRAARITATIDLESITSPGKAVYASPRKFEKDFSRPMSIPEEGIEAVVEVMRSGRLFRYCATDSHVAQAEVEFAEMVGSKYALGVNSCSSAILLALIVSGVKGGARI